MRVLPSPEDYLFNLEATTQSQAKRLWKERIKENWNHQCAYCGSTKDLTLDHIKPKALGGKDKSQNIVCACRECNHNKGDTPFEEWYQSQYFFSEERYSSINAWRSGPFYRETPNYKHIMRRLNICYGT